MSEQSTQQPPDEEEPPWPAGEPDDSEPAAERQAELRAAYEANIKVGKPPYAGVVIATRGEVNWIVRERGWRIETQATLEQAIDFRHSGFRLANLKGLNLTLANLRGAIIAYTNFANATLNRSDLSGAIIVYTNFDGADFTAATLRDAIITNTSFIHASSIAADMSGVSVVDADFSNADLSGVDLSNSKIVPADTFVNFTATDLSVANLSGAVISGKFGKARLRQARMDSQTVLGATSDEYIGAIFLDGATQLLDVAWNGAILANVQWEQVPRLGDEADIKAASTRKERLRALRDAARAYRGLAKALQAQGLTIPALKYRTREQQLERKALFWSFKPGQWTFSWLLNLVSGYGDRPGRAVACYIGVVATFAAAYFAITNGLIGFIASHSTRLAWYEALVLSISSFHGRGFFPSVPSLGDPIAIVAAVEAIIGLFIELVFIATFTQRFFAR